MEEENQVTPEETAAPAEETATAPQVFNYVVADQAAEPEAPSSNPYSPLAAGWFMTDKEAYIHEWMSEASKENPESSGFSVCPYASSSKTLIVETNIDDIVPESGHDVIIFIVEDFWREDQVQNWVKFYNDKYSYYAFFEDSATQDTYINGIKTNTHKYNLILCQSRARLSKIRKNLAKTGYDSYWSEEYLKEILGDDYENGKKEEISG